MSRSWFITYTYHSMTSAPMPGSVFLDNTRLQTTEDLKALRDALIIHVEREYVKQKLEVPKRLCVVPTMIMPLNDLGAEEALRNRLIRCLKEAYEVVNDGNEEDDNTTRWPEWRDTIADATMPESVRER